MTDQKKKYINRVYASTHGLSRLERELAERAHYWGWPIKTTISDILNQRDLVNDIKELTDE